MPRDAKLRCPGSRHVGAEAAHRAPQRRARRELLGEVPDVSGDEACGARDAAHLGQGARPLRNEVDDERGGHDVERGVRKRKLARVRDLELRAVSRRPARGGADLRRRGVDAVDTCRSAKLDQRLRENARAAADIEPARAPCRAEPVEEHRRDRAAPAAHAPLVGRAAVEPGRRFRHVTRPSGPPSAPAPR